MSETIVSRRSVLGRLLGLGAGAAAAAALPALSVQAEPVAPPAVEVLPDWLTGDPELARGLERLARAMAAYPGPKHLMDNLLDHQADLLETVTRTWNDPRPAPRPAPGPEPARAVAVDPSRVITIQFARLDRNQRRRLRRWVERQPVGPEHPLHRLRTRFRNDTHDMLDVAIAERPSRERHLNWQRIPETYAKILGWRLTRSLDLTTPLVACSHLRGHSLHDFGIGDVDLAVFPDGRVADYAGQRA